MTSEGGGGGEDGEDLPQDNSLNTNGRLRAYNFQPINRFENPAEPSLSLLPAEVHQSHKEKERSSLILLSLVELLAAAYEKEESRRTALVTSISQSLIKMKLLNPTYVLSELSGLRSQYSLAFLRLISVARSSIPSSLSGLPALLGPEHDLSSNRQLPAFLKSRYHQEFDQGRLLGRGGFGSVYLAVNKLDQVEYAVKKINILLTKTNLVFKILREVTLLAKLSHPNIVSYKTAWTEACYSDITSNGSSHSIREIIDDEDDGDDDDDDEEEEELSDSEEEMRGGIKFSRQSAVITEVSGSPSGWSSEVERVVGRPASPHLRLAGGLGRFWGPESSRGSQSGEVEFREQSVVLQRQDSPESEISQTATLFIQMELCQETLREWLDFRNSLRVVKVDIRDNFKIFRQLLSAAHYLHEKGILHRDIKPRNIFINNELHVKLGDFGLAKEELLSESGGAGVPGTPQELRSVTLRPGGRRETDSTAGVGTTAYAAPEQLRSGRVDSRSDMFSLGVVLYELCIVPNTEMERVVSINKLRERDRRSLDSLQCQWPEIRNLIWELTSPSPGERPGAGELLEQTFSSKDLTLVERDLEMEALRETNRLQAAQISKQEQLITQQTRELEILRNLLTRLRKSDE